MHELHAFPNTRPLTSRPSDTTIWLVGSRRAAEQSAARLGLRFVTIDSSESVLSGCLPVERAKRFPKERPAGIVSVTEGAVPLAAELSRVFGTPSISVETASLCTNKIAMKQAAQAAGIPTAKWMATTPDTTPDEVIAHCGLPVVLKEPVASGSRGVRVCRTIEELRDALGEGLLCESFVSGIEMSVETLMQWNRCKFRNYTRYLVPGWASIVPADLSADQQKQIDDVIDRIHAAFRIHTGITHAEVFLTNDGVIFGEIAARPPGGRLMELIQSSYEFDLWNMLLRTAIDHPVAALPTKATRYSGVWFLHPGKGVVSHVSGRRKALSIPGVNKVNLRARAGQHITQRLGTGQSCGEVFAVGTDMQACEHALDSAHSAIEIGLRPNVTPVPQFG